MSWDPCDHAGWQETRDWLVASELVWPESAIRHDLRWWAARVRLGWASRIPSSRRLAGEWGVSRKVARRVMADEQGWSDPRFAATTKGPTTGPLGAHSGPTQGPTDQRHDGTLARNGPTQGPPGAHSGPTKGHTREDTQTPTPTQAPQLQAPAELIRLLEYGETTWSWALADAPAVVAADVLSMLPAAPPELMARSLGDCHAWLMGQTGKPGGWSAGSWLVKLRQWVQRDLDRPSTTQASAAPELRALPGGHEQEARELWGRLVACGTLVRPVRESIEAEGWPGQWRVVCGALRSCAIGQQELGLLAGLHDLDRKRREAAFVDAYCRAAKAAA